MKRERLWTGERLAFLYSELVNQFGPHCVWEKRNSPGHGRDAEFEEFCETIAVIVGAKGANAVKVQINWGTPIPPGGTWNLGKVEFGRKSSGMPASFILNHAAAFNAGFITSADMPNIATLFRQGLLSEVE